MELQNYLSILRDRWIPALIAALLVLGAVVGFTLLQTPTYQAKNRMFVQTQAGGSVTELNSGVIFAQQQITSYADLATTPLVLEPVIEELGLDSSPQDLASQISTSVPPETLILEIAASSEDPGQAAEIANATAESLRQTVSELETDGNTSSVELTVIAPATTPSSPASPSLPRNLAVGLVLALMAGVATAVIRDLLDNRVRRPEDIEKTFERPVIAKIPSSRDTKHLPLIAAQHPQSLQAEAYRDLRTNLQFMGLAEGQRSVLITSSLPGEGKSSSAINLAHVIAQSGARVLLIDADLRRPSIHQYLSLEGNAGLTTVLIGEAELDELVQPLETEGLDVLTSGPIPPNPSEMVGSEKMEQLLATAMAQYDFVVVDAPPLLAVTDAVVLSHHVGGALVVARSEAVKKQQLAQALQKLESAGGRTLGVILNRVPTGNRGAYSYTYTYSSDESAVKPSAVAEAAGSVTPAATTETVASAEPARQQLLEQGASSDELGSYLRPTRRRAGRRRASTRPDDPSTTPRTWPVTSVSRGEDAHR
ncbi:polysaccharide biosynthesis tyrosine autokinase [Brachybacterium sp. AG952]|uniref:polysaccharide biosynthesis tyrosine autokinase n=1 Tax=Brachybacterium sp. AG952 TaxID=2183989 RepID=UPI0014153056|nr:polysaccharide biosynthesis tyrosine autokinase [Brachybacterium sp. AG952]